MEGHVMGGKFSSNPRPEPSPWDAVGFWIAYAFIALVVVGAVHDALVK
jgi:hypothetical protein